LNGNRFNNIGSNQRSNFTGVGSKNGYDPAENYSKGDREQNGKIGAVKVINNNIR
jgi:hypothetical protein